LKKNISDYVEMYLKKHSADEDKLHDFSHFLEKFFDSIKEEYEDISIGFLNEVEDFTEEIDEEMMREIVENLRQKDGSVIGAKWSIEETENVSKQYDGKNKV